MTDLAPTAALVGLSVAFAIHDAFTRTIPNWLLALAGAVALLGWPLHLWALHPFSALLGFVAFRLASFEQGDQWGMGIAAAFLPLWAAALAIVLTFLAGAGLLMLARWRGWDTAQWPFFPWVAASVIVARMVA